MIARFVRLVTTTLFVGLFVYTGLSKLIGYHEYVDEIQQSPILKGIPMSIAWILPVAEIGVAVMLLISRWRVWALMFCIILMGVFTIYLICLNRYNDYIPCSCGGIIDTLPRDIHIALDLALLLIAISALWIEKRGYKRIFNSNRIKSLS